MAGGRRRCVIACVIACAQSGAACHKSSPAPGVPASPRLLEATDLGLGKCFGVSADGRLVGSDDTSGAFVIDPAGQRTTLGHFGSDPVTVPLAINIAGQVIGYSESPQ